MPPELTPLPAFQSPVSDVLSALDLLRPPARVTVSEAAARYRVLHNPGGGYSGPWENERVPEMVEPMDMITNRRLRGVIFVGSAQSTKTDALILNPILHSAVVDPADAMVVQMSEAQAKDFSSRRVDRMNRVCREMHRRLIPGRAGQAVYTKAYRGMSLSLGWPTVSQLSSKPIPRMLLTDYDRMPQDVEGEGSPFALSLARIKTFGSRGYLVAESSPGFPIRVPGWKPSYEGSHEAPPCDGILALYNEVGDRRRRFWPCPECGEYFEGEFDHLHWPRDAPPAAAAEQAVMVCPANGCVIQPSLRREMRERGVWVPEGCIVGRDGVLDGEPRLAEFASYWLKGVSAPMQSWADLVRAKLSADAIYERTGDETTLKTVVNTALGLPYLPKAAEAGVSVDAEALIARADTFPRAVVPSDVRFLVPTVDVQGNRFECLVRGYGVGLESWVIDRFPLFEAANPTRPMSPPEYIEDWEVLFDRVFDLAYPVEELDGHEMRIAAVAIDSAGAPGTTQNAYRFYRQARAKGLHRKLILTKGEATPRTPRCRKTLPDSSDRKDRHAEARGEIPVWIFNTNLMKDGLAAQLGREDPGPLYVHLTTAFCELDGSSPFFEELTAESRNPDGTWKKIRQRNETLDCMIMADVAVLALGGERINWDAPPAWAAPHDKNPLVIHAGTQLQVPPSQRRGRRIRSRGIH